MRKKYPFSFVFAGIVFISCVIPGNSLPSSSWDMSDKFVHFISFAILYIVIFTEHLSIDRSSSKSSRWLIGAALISAGFGGLIELVQSLEWVQRSAELPDFVADVIGVGIGMLLSKFVHFEKIYWKLFRS